MIVAVELTFQANRKVIGPDGNPANDIQAGFEHEGSFHSVTGWMAYSKVPYKDDLMAGVRIYCRGKIAAQTNVFNQKAGFTGEHNIRSYLVGELHADWLDEQEDLIQTDRRDILWSDEMAKAFQAWGQRMVKRIGTLSRDPMRKATLDLFLETGNVSARVLSAYPHDEQASIRKHATEVARTFGRTMSRAEAEDPIVVDGLVDLSINLAPHITLDDMMKQAVDTADQPLSVLATFLRTARLAELSSFGRIAEDRLKVIDRLEVLKDTEGTQESDLQQLIADAPWLVDPEWAPVTANQSFTTLRREFEKYFQQKTGQAISLEEFEQTGKRPDFVLSSQEGILQIVEIKKPGHKLLNDEMDRIVAYYQNMESFLAEAAHSDLRKRFSDFHVTVVCDELGLTGTQLAAFNP